MRKKINILLNFIFFSIVIFIAFCITTIALTAKINEGRKNMSNGIKATVIKHETPILAFTSGVISKIYFKVGQEVKKNELLVEIDNPMLKGKIDALKQYKDNVSAQTEARVAEEELKGLKIYSPVNGVVTEISVDEGSPVQELSKIMTLYSNDDVRLIATLGDQDYQTIEKMAKINAYSARLNQNFAIRPDILRPYEKTDDLDEKKLGLYFVFEDPVEAKSLLNDEDLKIDLKNQDEKIFKPIDLLVNFWDRTIFKK